MINEVKVECIQVGGDQEDPVKEKSVQEVKVQEVKVESDQEEVIELIESR